MTWYYEVLAWEDYNGNRIDGEPKDPDESYGIYVHAYNTEDPEDQHYWWSFVGQPFEEWEDWNDVIYAQMEMHGMIA